MYVTRRNNHEVIMKDAEEILPASSMVLPAPHITAGPATQSEVNLTWVVVNGNGPGGQRAHYDVRYSLTPIADANDWDGAFQVHDRIIAAAAGTLQFLTVENLAPDTQYYFAIQVTDSVGRISPRSNCVSARTLPLRWEERPLATGYVNKLSLAYSPDGELAIAWAEGFGASLLKYAVWDRHANTWAIEVVARTEQAYYVQLTFSPDGVPMIAYTCYLKKHRYYAGFAEKTAAGWTVTLVDGLAPNSRIAMAIDPTDDQPALAYLIPGVQGDESLLTYAKRDPDGQWSEEIADVQVTNGSFVSLAFDQDWNPAIAYRAHPKLRYASRSPFGVWETEVLNGVWDREDRATSRNPDALSGGMDCRLAFDPIDGGPTIVHSVSLRINTGDEDRPQWKYLGSLGEYLHRPPDAPSWDSMVFDEAHYWSGKYLGLVYDTNLESPDFGTAFISCNASDRVSGIFRKCIRIRDGAVQSSEIFKMSMDFARDTDITLSPHGEPTIVHAHRSHSDFRLKGDYVAVSILRHVCGG